MLKVLFTNAGTIALAIVLGVGWMWMLLLKDMRVIDDDLRLRLLTIFTLVFGVQQAISLKRRFSKRKAVIRDQVPVIEFYLAGMLSEYYTRLQSLVSNSNEPLSPVRCNVMLPTMGYIGICLKISYQTCPPNSKIMYNNAEIQLEWKPNQGACGWAWENGKSCVYDSENKDRRLPEDTLSADQRHVVRHQKSVLALPIIYRGDIVGVLNLDSNENIEKTFFDHPSIYRLASGCAKELGVHCRID